MTKNFYNKPPGIVHYNVQFKQGGLMERATAPDLFGLRHQDIARVWVVEEMRNATPNEIQKLCKPSLEP